MPACMHPKNSSRDSSTCTKKRKTWSNKRPCIYLVLMLVLTLKIRLVSEVLIHPELIFFFRALLHCDIKLHFWFFSYRPPLLLPMLPAITCHIPYVHISVFLCMIDYLHGLGWREGAGLRSGPNVFTKVPRVEGFLTLQVFSTSCKFSLGRYLFKTNFFKPSNVCFGINVVHFHGRLFIWC